MAILEITEFWDDDLRSADPLHFPGYTDKLDALAAGAIVAESVRTGRSEHAVVIEGDFSVLGGSMGVVHGEKVVRAIDRAIGLGLPVVVETRSGGARMQEGMVSLIQMARTAAAIGRLRSAGLASYAVLHNPTTGGVFASYASLCDVIAARAGATIGFAGPRVAEAFTGKSVEGRSHTAETAYAGGLVDFVGDDAELASWLRAALLLHDRSLDLGRPARRGESDLASGTASSDGDSDSLAEDDAWSMVLRARRADRPSGLEVAAVLVDSWTDLHGVDPTVRAGLARVGDEEVVVIAEDRHAGNGRPTPAGYALARRAIALAARRALPIVTFIDTPGAEPGSDAEQGGIARSIAETFFDLSQVRVPTVAVCVGEGGSGGALAFGVADRLLIQRHAVFSVIGAEGAAAILHRDASRAPEAAGHLRLTSTDLVELGIADAVVPDDPEQAAEAVRSALGDARPGERIARLDNASWRWITRSTPG